MTRWKSHITEIVATRTTTNTMNFVTENSRQIPCNGTLHRVRKRSLALVGLFVPSMMTVEASPFAQHRVRAPKRAVSYVQSGRIPSNVVSTHDKMESTTEMGDANEFIWDLHVDALVHEESVDSVFDAIRRGLRSSSLNHETSRSIRRTTVATLPGSSSLRQRRLATSSSATSVPFLDDAFFNESASFAPLDAAHFNSSSSNTAGSVFNASVDTVYRVDVGGSNTTTVNDSSSTVYASFTMDRVHTTTTAEPAEDSNDNTAAAEDASATSSNSNTTTEFRPLRMRAFLSERAGGGQHLKALQRSSLLLEIVKPALLAWSAALRVQPVAAAGGNLTVDRHQLVDGLSCGPGGNLPSVIVPTEHLTTGVADTDFIVYLSLAFQSKNQSNATTENQQSSSLNVDGLSSGANDQTTTPLNDDKQQCNGDYLAASAFCSTDQFDRPTAAILHLCIGDDFFDTASRNRNIMVVLHELGHALGFNAVSLAHFRRPDGTPYTERNPLTNEIPLTEVNCTGPAFGPNGQRQREKIPLPSSEVLQFREVRGGVRVAEIVTPSVRQVVRNHFDCQELPGAELESGEFLPLSTIAGEVSCLGDHWERRLFKTDLMNPTVDDNVEFNPRFSTITLAYFADSGWYQVDLSRASLSAGWGRAAGCAFIEETCIHIEDGQVPSTFDSFFCNSPPSLDSGSPADIQGCTTDMTRKASCSIDSYEGELPSEYQYFNLEYGANFGGTDPFMDYCPVYTGFANGLCSDSENEAVIGVNLIEKFGKRNSRCLSGQLSRRLSTESQEASDSLPTRETTTAALCLPIACVVEDQSLRIQVDGEWTTCHKKGDVIVLPATPSTSIDNDGSDAVVSVICPDPIRICPTFYCNRDCLGTNRLCDYNVGKCVCNSTKTRNDYKTWNETSFAGRLSRHDEFDNEICDFSNATDGADTASSHMFYKPDDEDDSGLPSPDSPLSDIYVPTERHLMESDGFWSNRFKRITIGSVTTACLVFALLSYWVLRHRPRLDQQGTDQDGGDDPSTSVQHEINPDKHKLMASIVVNIRMNDPSRRPRDALANRDSETELSMTDTEGTLDQPSLDEFSFEIPSSDLVDGTIVDLSGCDNLSSRLQDEMEREYGIDPLAAPSATPVVRRRRHLFSSSFL